MRNRSERDSDLLFGQGNERRGVIEISRNKLFQYKLATHDLYIKLTQFHQPEPAEQCALATCASRLTDKCLFQWLNCVRRLDRNLAPDGYIG